MVVRLDTMPTTETPAKIPASAIPMGRPIASTEPKAMMRITMAKPMPMPMPRTLRDGRGGWGAS